eukprot:1195829-Prorocentrum_minimum.AAC.1
MRIPTNNVRAVPKLQSAMNPARARRLLKSRTLLSFHLNTLMSMLIAPISIPSQLMVDHLAVPKREQHSQVLLDTRATKKNVWRLQDTVLLGKLNGWITNNYSGLSNELSSSGGTHIFGSNKRTGRNPCAYPYALALSCACSHTGCFY